MKILIADDHALVRQGLISILSEFADAAFIEAEDSNKVLNIVETDDEISIILLDLFMPGERPFDLIRSVRKFRPETPIVVISGSNDPDHMRKSFDYGASGFISKSAARSVLISAIRLVMAGGIYVPPELIGRSEPIDSGSTREASTEKRVISSVRSDPFELTARQQQVLKLIINGYSNKEIATELGVSDNTVKIHVASILRALGVKNRTKAALVAKEAGFQFDLKNENR